ncbi:MAG: hypothetical protein IIC67_03235 [Thaumarchaeota archaeon]|nr:hypothetical protein [Nitrososphaerota archaeon]
MKRFSRKWFAQIMIHRLLKRELDQLKFIIAKEMNATWKLSYNDEIKFLIKNFKESRRIEVSLEPKLLLGNSLKNSRLKISSKLDGKQRISYSLES